MVEWLENTLFWPPAVQTRAWNAHVESEFTPKLIHTILIVCIELCCLCAASGRYISGGTSWQSHIDAGRHDANNPPPPHPFDHTQSKRWWIVLKEGGFPVKETKKEEEEQQQGEVCILSKNIHRICCCLWCTKCSLTAKFVIIAFYVRTVSTFFSLSEYLVSSFHELVLSSSQQHARINMVSGMWTMEYLMQRCTLLLQCHVRWVEVVGTRVAFQTSAAVSTCNRRLQSPESACLGYTISRR